MHLQFIRCIIDLARYTLCACKVRRLSSFFLSSHFPLSSCARLGWAWLARGQCGADTRPSTTTSRSELLFLARHGFTHKLGCCATTLASGFWRPTRQAQCDRSAQRHFNRLKCKRFVTYRYMDRAKYAILFKYDCTVLCFVGIGNGTRTIEQQCDLSTFQLGLINNNKRW